ncbi:AAA ATPase [Methylocella silvestris BL2]|uniref:AAA ATPase n=1 Tax=Methylocella silvestris (strain DSM 15510 / CIP 108128 / LMG 27833 / NCIMB 13906 / BL2) TaxID=395965 RepID=B8ELC5_METSB|nr:DNA polymerase III subunit delta' [Methylocella silvestris]ACK49514.1 AAA ATPase [Methylocella silvestris BL2]
MAPKALTDNDAVPESDRFEDAPHPRAASDFIGHEEAEAELLRACAAGQLPHAILIGGPSGVGKATLAWRLARFLLVNREPAAAAAKAQDLATEQDHPAARQALSLAHPDLFVLRREWNEKTKKLATEIRVEDVRRAIHMFHQAAGGQGYRVAIVDSAEDLNASGANALLKLIEEPPPRCVFIIIAHRPGRVLATIRSRCRKLMLKPLQENEVARIVATLGPPWSQAPKPQLQDAIARTRGSLHGTLRLLSGRGLELDGKLRRMLGELPKVDWRATHALAEEVAPRDNADDYDALLAAVYDWLEARVRNGAGDSLVRPGALAPYAEVWEKVTEAAQQTEALNLDKRPFVLALFADLAAAARAASA